MNLELPQALADRIEKLKGQMPLNAEALACECVKEGLGILEAVAERIETPREEPEQPRLSRGAVRFFDTRKSWGIVTDRSGESVFVHSDELPKGTKRGVTQKRHGEDRCRVRSPKFQPRSRRCAPISFGLLNPTSFRMTHTPKRSPIQILGRLLQPAPPSGRNHDGRTT